MHSCRLTERIKGRTRWLAAAALVVICAFTSARAASTSPIPLEGAWRTVAATDNPAQVIAEAESSHHLPRFDAAAMQHFGDPREGTWVILLPRSKPPAGVEQLTLSIRASPMTAVTLYGEDGRPQRTNALDNFDDKAHGYGRIIFSIPAWRATSPLLLKVEPSTYPAAPINFTLLPAQVFHHSNALWLAALGACFGVMLAMATMGLCFGAFLRDSTFFWYAAYIFAYTAIQISQTGFIYHPLGLSALSGGTAGMIGLSLAVAAPCAVMFMLRFCDIDTFVPALRKPILAMAAAMMVVALGRLIPLSSLHMIAEALINPMLILGAVTMLVGSGAAAARGSRPAWYFLAGWAPLLVVTAMASAQTDGAFPDLPWLNDAGIPTGALEALVLSAGLADRALNLRRDRDRARELADRDPLTGVLNRRGWIEAVQKRLANAGRHPQAVLFLDLDHFKKLNDELGHAAGDRALVAVSDALSIDLRPEDILARYGGEEFIIFLDHTAPQVAMHIAVRLRRRIYRLDLPVDADGHMLTVSIGVAHVRPEDTLPQLVERADKAMYAAKTSGRNRVIAESDVAYSLAHPHLRAVPPPDPADERAGPPRRQGASPGQRDGSPTDET